MNEKTTEWDISRRKFLTGAALGAIGIAGSTVLGGCSPSGKSSNASSTESSAPKQADETRSSDIVIVGSGATGCMAAYQAIESGIKSITIVTKSGNATDSNFNEISGTCAVETDATAAIGQTFTKVDLFNHMIKFAHWTVDAKLVRDCVMMLSDNISILKTMGVETMLLGDRYNVGFSCVHGYVTKDKGKPVADYLTGKGVEFVYDAPATHILMEDDKVTGVQIEQGGKVIDIEAKAVLVCTGGYMANDDMLKKTYGDVELVNMGNIKNTGDGQKMVLEAGGIEDRIHGLGMNDIYGMNKKSTISVFNANPFMQLAFYGGLVVDPSGQRFMNEYMLAQEPMSGGGEATLHVQRYYAIFSENVLNGMKDTSYYASIGSPAVWTSAATMFNAPLADFDKNLKTAVDEGWCFKAGSINELASTAGLPGLSSTVTEYDKMVAAGQDTLFYKRQEFLRQIEDGSQNYYVFEYNPSAFNTFGGPRTDAQCRVLKANFEPIPGLYMGGVENGSLFCTPYYDCGGSCSGLSMSSGRLAAQYMAQYIK